MNNQEINTHIRKKFHVKHHDNLPFSGWWDSTRIDIVDLFAELGYTKGAEIGVCKAQFSEVMLKKIPNLKLYGVDPWWAYDRLTQDKAEIRYQKAMKKLQPFLDQVVILKKSSMEALSDVPDKSLDFVFIDGMHDFDHVMEDLINWSKKVRTGGIVSGHDYYKFYQSGIITAVNAYTLAHNITEWYITREKEASFFWVKS